MRTWFITGVSSGFGLEMTKQLLAQGDRVIGTVRHKEAMTTLCQAYPQQFDCRILDVRDIQAIKECVQQVMATYNGIDVLVNNAGYGLFGAAEELSDTEISDIINTNLLGSIHMIHAILPYMRKRQKGHIIQISSYGGQVAFAGNAMYHATKWGIEGFCEAVEKEMKPFHVKMTIVEPGGARTQFRYRSAKVATLTKAYDKNPAHDFIQMLDAANGLAPGDPVKMVEKMIACVSLEEPPLRMVLGSQALQTTVAVLEERLDTLRQQTTSAAFSDIKE